MASPSGGGNDIFCDACHKKFNAFLWTSYFCPGCDEHADAMYREEHRDVERAARMNRADIIEEYRLAGIPFRPVVLERVSMGL